MSQRGWEQVTALLTTDELSSNSVTHSRLRVIVTTLTVRSGRQLIF